MHVPSQAQVSVVSPQHQPERFGVARSPGLLSRMLSINGRMQASKSWQGLLTAATEALFSDSRRDRSVGREHFSEGDLDRALRRVQVLPILAKDLEPDWHYESRIGYSSHIGNDPTAFSPGYVKLISGLRPPGSGTSCKIVPTRLRPWSKQTSQLIANRSRPTIFNRFTNRSN